MICDTNLNLSIDETGKGITSINISNELKELQDNTFNNSGLD